MKFNKQSGQASRLLLVLAVVVLVAVIITYLILKMAEKPTNPGLIPVGTVALPVYEQTLDDIHFVFISALDEGDALRASDILNKDANSSQHDVVVDNPGAKFVEVTIAAQNVGTIKTNGGGWGLGNIIDSKGRIYEIANGFNVSPWLPNPDLCGSLLQPAFEPIQCARIYEISKESGVTGLKVQIQAGRKSYLLDLIVK